MTDEHPPESRERAIAEVGAILARHGIALPVDDMAFLAAQLPMLRDLAARVADGLTPPVADANQP